MIAQLQVRSCERRTCNLRGITVLKAVVGATLETAAADCKNYSRMPPNAARAMDIFRRLSGLSLTDFAGWVSARLSGCSLFDAH
jgi:hypothetical protein